MGSRIPGPPGPPQVGPSYGGRHESVISPVGQGPAPPSVPSIPQPVFPDIGQPQATTKPPLDHSHVSRTSSLQSDGWGGRHSSDGYTRPLAPPPVMPQLEMPTTTETAPDMAEMQLPVDPLSGYHQKPVDSGTYPPETSYPSQAYGADGYEGQQGSGYDGGYVGGYEEEQHGGYGQQYDHYHQDVGYEGYKSYEQRAQQDHQQETCHLEPEPNDLATKRKPPPAIAKESPLKALYAKGAENYDGNRRKISLTAVMDYVATSGMRTGDQRYGAYPSVEEEQKMTHQQLNDEQPRNQYSSEYPSEYPAPSEYPSEQHYGGGSEYPSEYPHAYQEEYPSEYQSEHRHPESTLYPPSHASRDASEHANLGQASAAGSTPQLYRMPGQASNQGSSQSFNAEDASTSRQPWNNANPNASNESRDSLDRGHNPLPTAGPGNPGMGHMFQPVNPGSPGGALNPTPPTFDQARQFVPGQGGAQGMEATEAVTQQPRTSVAAKAPKIKKKRLFLFRPFSFFYQMIFVACLVLNPAWTVTKMALFGGLVHAGVAGYSGMSANAFRSTLAKQYVETHRVFAYADTIESVFKLVGGASADAWVATTARVPCEPASTTCVWARKVLHAGLTGGLVSQRSVLAGYKHLPRMVSHAGGVASRVKTFLMSADTWKLDGLRSNIVGVSKSAYTFANCLGKNAIYSSSLLDLTSKAIDCGTFSFADMLNLKADVDPGVSDAVVNADFASDKGLDAGEEEEVAVDDKQDDMEVDDYEDPYAADLEAMSRNATLADVDVISEDAEKTTEPDAVLEERAEEVIEAVDPESFTADDHSPEPTQGATEIENPAVTQVAMEPDVVSEPDEVLSASGEAEEVVESIEEVVEPIEEVVEPIEEVVEPIEEVVEPIEEVVEPIEEVVEPIEEVVEPIEEMIKPPVVDGSPETTAQDAIPPFAMDDDDQAMPEDPGPYSEDYPPAQESPEEIQARAQRRIDHDKKLADRMKNKSGDLRSVLSDVPLDQPVEDTVGPTADGMQETHVSPPSISPSVLDTLMELVQANMTHIITAVISATLASSVFIVQGMRARGAGFSLAALSDLLNAIPRTPRPARRNPRLAAARTDDSEDEENNEATVVKRNARSNTPRPKARRSTTADRKKPASQATSEGMSTRRSSRRSASRK